MASSTSSSSSNTSTATNNDTSSVAISTSSVPSVTGALSSDVEIKKFDRMKTAMEKAVISARKAIASEFGSDLTDEEVFSAVQTALESLFSSPPQLHSPAASATPKKPVRGYIDGCFDIMHAGHYNAIRQARMICDYLVVGVHSDEEIARNKGPPVMKNEERLATVKACKWVDEVVFDTPYDPTLALLDKLNCDFAIHGDDMPQTADGNDAYGEVKKAGRLRIIKRTAGVSTTDLVGRLLLMTKNHFITSSSPSVSPAVRPSSITLSPPNLSLSDPSMKGSSTASKWVVDTKGNNDHYAHGVSSFLPTTWRITQFANNRPPKATDKIVYIDGAFDLFHVGHIETLRKARELGDFLYVGVHDDLTVNNYKGSNYPIMNLHERVLNVLSCKYVDEVVMGAPWEVTEDLIKVLNIHLVVAGSNTKMDENAALPDEKDDPYRIPKSKKIFHEVDSTTSMSTADVVERIIQNRLQFEKRNAVRSKKELDYLASRQYVAEV